MASIQTTSDAPVADAPAPRSARKGRTKPPRSLNVVTKFDGILLIKVKEGSKSELVFISGNATGGFRWEKELEAGGEIYQVGTEVCSCRGHREHGHRGTVCRHRSAIATLVRLGHLA